MNIKQVLTDLTVAKLRTNQSLLQGAVANKESLEAALTDSSYDEIRTMNQSIESTERALGATPGTDTIALTMLVKEIKSGLAAALEDKGKELMMLQTTASGQGGLVLRNADELLTHPDVYMPVLVHMPSNDMIGFFNEAVERTRKYGMRKKKVSSKKETDEAPAAYTPGQSNDEEEVEYNPETYRNSKVVRSFTSSFKQANNEKIENMEFRDAFLYAYKTIFGDIGARLKGKETFQWADIIDFHNPIYALVLLAAGNKGEKKIVEDIRDEARLEADHGNFDTNLFVRNCHLHPEIMAFLPPQSLLANIKPETYILSDEALKEALQSDAEGKTPSTKKIQTNSGLIYREIMNDQEKGRLIKAMIGMDIVELHNTLDGQGGAQQATDNKQLGDSTDNDELPEVRI